MKHVQMANTQLTENEIDAAIAVLRSGALRQGNECSKFENEFAKMTGAKAAVTCANGTAALHLAYLSILNPGDEVLVPGFTFIATASMVSMSGGKPVFCDVHKDSFLIDLEDAEGKITEKTRAIAPVHLFGNACEIEAIQKFAEKHNLKIIWDAAQSHGTTYHNIDVGAFGDFVCYSFYPTKNMFVGEGGMVCTDNSEYEHKLRFLRAHGQTAKYRHTMLGLNYRMTDVEGAIGYEQLKRLDTMLSTRRSNAKIYNEAFSSIDGIQPQAITDNTEHSWHQYCALIDPEKVGINRDTLIEKLKDRGVSSGIHYPRGLHKQPIFEEMYGTFELPITDFLTEHIIALPVHHGMSEEDAQYVVESVRACIG